MAKTDETPEQWFGHPLHDPQASAETLLRGEWWMRHPNRYGGDTCLPYGDDGEMQCCGLDFRRMPLSDLKAEVYRLRMERAAAWLTGPQPSRKDTR